MPVINTEKILDISSEIIEFNQTLLLDNLTLTSDIDTNVDEVIVKANTLEFDDENLVKNLLNFLISLKNITDKKIGLQLSGEVDFAKIKPFLSQIFTNISLIVIDFAGFRDGRGYSFAKQLQHDSRFSPNLTLRATGGLIADSLPLLQRVGFSEFVVDDAVFKPHFFEHFDKIRHYYDGKSSQILPMFAHLQG
ncbi:DUF934 domain-containing protein [Faucicola boevrei]|uniref:DUF934 domain-containing protein n=1 Tax=Faucicola boevrei TaxID=346665 RepID=UPI00038235C0|nr:DUF934 domain-containing protein [Moraxella boevrei]